MFKLLIQNFAVANVAEGVKDRKILGQVLMSGDFINDESKKRIRDLVFHFVENEYI